MLWREENPFTGRFQKFLSPQGDNDLNMLYVNVDGFRQAAPDIEKWRSPQQANELSRMSP